LYLYRIQYAVNDNEYSKAMEAKTNTYDVAKLTKNIIQNDSRAFIDSIRLKI
jgi:hypothetical protein